MNVIAISGMPGSGSTTVSKIIAEKLKMKHFSPGRAFKDLAMGAAKEQFYYFLLKGFCDDAKLKIPEISSSNDSNAAADLWKTDFGKSEKLHKIIDYDLQQKLAEKGNIVIDGKLSLHMLKNSKKIWLKATLDERAKRTAKRDSLDLENAKTILQERQNNERESWKQIYNFDYFDQEAIADLVIDTTTISAEKVAEEILAKL